MQSISVLSGNAFNIAWGIGWALYLMLSKEVKRVYSEEKIDDRFDSGNYRCGGYLRYSD